VTGDPDVPPVTVQLRPGELLRFGPGVPVPVLVAQNDQETEATEATIQAAAPTAVVEDRQRGRRLVRWLLFVLPPLLVLAAVLAFLLPRRAGPALVISDIMVQSRQQSLGCGGTETITGTLHTNGAAGTITYRWSRSDGTVSGGLRQQVGAGVADVDVVLLWSFHGRGALQPSATLEVTGPDSISAGTVFAYVCK